MQTTYLSDFNQYLSKNVPYWDRFGRYLVIFTLVVLGKTLSRFLVRTIKGDRVKVRAEKEGEKKEN
jgi:hypothetical protein